MREGREEDDGKEIRLAFEEESSVGMKVEDIKKREKENGVGVSFLKQETLELIFRAPTTLADDITHRQWKIFILAVVSQPF
jgi:hypothetical protein